MELDKQLILNWLKHFGINDIIEKHVSGHACGPELKNMLNKIKPKHVFPIHSEHPGKFRDITPHTIRIQKNKKYKVKWKREE